MVIFRRMNLALALLVVLFAAAPSMADTFTYSGITGPNSPQFRRPVESGDAFSPLVDNLGNPVLVRYSAFSFSVNQGGAYDFLSVQAFDGFRVPAARLYGHHRPAAHRTGDRIVPGFEGTGETFQSD